MKAILATGELATLNNVAKASWVCMMAGADFIKTSTGKESVNATLPFSLVMVRAIRAFHELTGYLVGYKPAGGINKAKEALEYLILIKEELGNQWLTPHLFRFGASSLLGDRAPAGASPHRQLFGPVQAPGELVNEKGIRHVRTRHFHQHGLRAGAGKHRRGPGMARAARCHFAAPHWR
jgi:hypothetical protein